MTSDATPTSATPATPATNVITILEDNDDWESYAHLLAPDDEWEAAPEDFAEVPVAAVEPVEDDDDLIVTEDMVRQVCL